MQIIHDRSHIGPTSREFISRGYACESFHSLRLGFVYTEAQQAENRAYADRVGLDSAEWRARIEDAARLKSRHMERIAALLAKNFSIFQYDEEVEYSSDWDFFFWCSDFSQTMQSRFPGRDYSYFTLTFRDTHDPVWRQRLYDRAMRVLDLFADDANLEVAVQYTTIMDYAKIHDGAELAVPGLAGRTCTHRGMDGRIERCNGLLYFRKKRSRTYIHRLTDDEILELSWRLLE